MKDYKTDHPPRNKEKPDYVLLVLVIVFTALLGRLIYAWFSGDL